MTNDPSISSSRGIKRQLPRRLGLVLLLFDAAALLMGFIFTKSFSGVVINISDYFGWPFDFSHFDTRRYYYIVLCAFILFRFGVKGHYSRRLPWLGQVEGIVKTIAFAALFDVFNYYFQDHQGIPTLMLLNWAICALLLIFTRQVSIMLISFSKRWRLPLVLVGDSRMIMDSFYAFYADGLTGYEVKVVLLTDADKNPDFDLSFLPKTHPPVDVYKDVEKFSGFIESHRNYYYIFGMDELRGPQGEAYVAATERSQIEYGVIPHTKTLDIYGTEPHYFFGNDVMILHRRDSIRSPSGRFLKRLIDIVATGVFLPFLGILTGIVYLAKKIEGSETPVFYGGKRVGMNGRLFHCWKFCTMKANADQILQDIVAKDENARAEWDKFKKLKNDPRVDSKISRILRKTSLDELPQLWNVFCGDMSLVGPRPILEDQKDDYGVMIEQYYAVRPGLTGLWQVSGRNETSFQQRVYWDGWYIRNWSLWYDIVILFKTVRVFMTGAGAY
jgi:Undecaprenyl-phosphate galactose phosphotransferase WbaP